MKQDIEQKPNRPKFIDELYDNSEPLTVQRYTGSSDCITYIATEKAIEICKKHLAEQQGLSAANAGYASEAVPACGNCVLMPFCGIYKKWKEDEAEYFEKDIEDFYCKHFTASKPEA